MTRTPDESKNRLSLYTPEEVKAILQQKWTIHLQEKLYRSAFAYIQQLEATVSEKEKVVAELSGKIGQLEEERDAAVKYIGVLTVILKKYPYAATNGCAYEAYMEIKKYIEAVRGVQKEE